MEPISIDEYRRTEAKHMLEETLRQRVKALARELGWMSYHTYNSQKSDKGWPDMALVHPKRGRFMVRELKRQKGKATKQQNEWLDAMWLAGVDVGIWRPMDLFDETILRELTATHDPMLPTPPSLRGPTAPS